MLDAVQPDPIVKDRRIFTVVICIAAVLAVLL